ncbi:MAG: SIR2 family protein [Dehalococcoidia bacterium]
MPLPTSLLRDFRNGSGALFLGAGISAGTPGQRGFPLGRELSQQLAREYLGRNPRRDENLTEVAQAVIWAHAGSRQPLESFISNKYGDPSITPLPSHLALAQMAVPMITTNYDTLIEQAFRAKVRSVSVVLDDKDLIDAQHTPLIKIHGCVTQPETCIITEEDYHAWMSLDSDVKSLVRSWFIMRRVVFVGYSVADPNFRHLLLELQRKFGHSLRNCYVVTRHVDRNSYNYQFLVNAIRAQFIIVSAQEFLAELSSELIQNYVHYLQTDLVKDYLSIYTNISRPLSEFLGDRLLERIFTNSAGRIELDRQVTDSIHAAAVAQSGRLYVPSPGVTVEPGMVYVPAGEFIMGGDRLGNERIRVEQLGRAT